MFTVFRPLKKTYSVYSVKNLNNPRNTFGVMEQQQSKTWASEAVKRVTNTTKILEPCKSSDARMIFKIIHSYSYYTDGREASASYEVVGVFLSAGLQKSIGLGWCSSERNFVSFFKKRKKVSSVDVFGSSIRDVSPGRAGRGLVNLDDSSLFNSFNESSIVENKNRFRGIFKRAPFTTMSWIRISIPTAVDYN